ncbi:hypothetical protein ACI2J5_19000 [Agrobacterium pusense]|uniref:hypothetical protein n=1 Tax=Agrobacterium pusense TaxID=648995 RepID=UPI00384E2D7E
MAKSDSWGPETLEIYSKVIFDDILHFADTEPEPIEGWGASGIAKIVAAIDHDYAGVIQAFYADVERRLGGAYEMWAEIGSLDVHSIRFVIEGVDYFFHNRFVFYEDEALPGWKPFG